VSTTASNRIISVRVHSPKLSGRKKPEVVSYARGTPLLNEVGRRTPTATCLTLAPRPRSRRHPHLPQFTPATHAAQLSLSTHRNSPPIRTSACVADCVSTPLPPGLTVETHTC